MLKVAPGWSRKILARIGGFESRRGIRKYPTGASFNWNSRVRTHPYSDSVTVREWDVWFAVHLSKSFDNVAVRDAIIQQVGMHETWQSLGLSKDPASSIQFNVYTDIRIPINISFLNNIQDWIKSYLLIYQCPGYPLSVTTLPDSSNT